MVLNLRRRGFLAAGAAGLATLACRRRAAPAETAFLGPSMDLGHRLRDGQVPRPDAFEPVDVLIVGGGVAGLTAAWRLRGAGFEDFRVLELEAAPGGTARAGGNGISAFPWGAHYLPAPTSANAPLLRLLDEMGLIEGRNAEGEPVFDEAHLVRAPEERLFAHGQWWEGLYLRAGASPEDERQHHAFFAEVEHWSRWRDARGRRAFAVPRAQGSDAPEVRALDALSFETWLDQRGLTSPRLRWLLDYACRDDYGARLDGTSAWAGLFYFTARKTGAGEDSRPLLTWPEGNGRLVAHLAGAAGARLRTGLAATRLEAVPRGVRIQALDATTGQAVGFQARRVIFAGPQHVAGRVIPELWRARPGLRTAFQQSPWLVANLTLRGRPREAGFPLAWDNVLQDSPSLGYVVATHQSLHDHGPTVWTWYHPFPDGDPLEARRNLLRMDPEACRKLVFEDLRRAHPDLAGLVARVDLVRWGHAMVRPSPGFCWSRALTEAARPLGAIHFAHTDLSGMALFEEAFDHGLRAAEEVLTALGRREPSWR